MQQLYALTIGLLLVACGRDATTDSSLTNIPEIQSMWQRADGQFDVLCRDNSREVVSASMLQKQLVCNGSTQLTENFQTGGGGGQGGTGPIDIVIVIDNSSSMEGYQALMRDALSPIISGIQNRDWQIGIVTTDSACLRGGKTLTRADYLANFSEVENRFKNAITPGGGGAVIERGILYATEAAKGNCGNPSQKWFRDQSQVAALVISDEPNCGGASDEGCPGQAGEKAEYFTDHMPANSKFFGLLFDQDNPNCPYLDMPPPLEYWKLVESTGGLWGDICASSYESFLSRMSSELARTGGGGGGSSSNEVVLSNDPNPDQLIIRMNGVELKASEYELSGRKIRILKPVEGGGVAQVSIIYKRA